MADPTKYKPHFNYSGWEQDSPIEPKPGAELDVDFDDIARSIDETIDALKDVRRSDGKLNNAIVTFDSLNPAVKAAIAGSEFDYEVIEDLLAKDANLQDLPDKAEARENLGAAGRAANLSDLTNVAEARSNLGTFSSVAEVQSRHIPAVLESIRTLGYSEPGVGDADYRRMLVPEVDQPGQIVAADGSRWALVGSEITAEACGALADGSDDAEPLQIAAAAAVAADATLVLSVGRTYTFSQLVIPAGCKIRAAGAKLQYLGTLANFEDVSLTFEAGSSIDILHYLTPGNESNAYGIFLEDDVEVSFLTATAVQQRPNSFLEIRGNNVSVGLIKTRNIDRPVHVNGAPNGTYGSHIGYLDVQSYVRGIKYTNHSDFVLGGHYMRGRSPNVDPNTITPGHNGILLSGASAYVIGDGRVDDAGEHAYRIGGNSDGGSSKKGKFGSLTAFRPRASAFKCNPLGGLDLAEDIEIASIVGVDCGDGGATGKTPDFVRISKGHRIRVGYAACIASSLDNACLSALTCNDVVGLNVGHLHVDQGADHAFTIDFEKDDPDGPVSNVHIGNITGTVTGGSPISIYGPEEVSHIYIQDMEVTGYKDRLIGFSADANIAGPIHIGARAAGVLPTILNAPPRDDVTLDLVFGTTRYTGPMYRYRPTAGALQVSGETLDPGNVFPNGLFLNGQHLPDGLNAYGVGVEFGRPGSVRRGAAIAPKQTGSNAYNMGLAFFRGNPGINSSDAIAEGMVLDHEGNLSVVGALSKGSGTFCIDHPLDPYNRDLVHGFVEAPEYGLIYRGRVTLQDGSAEVDIDAACGMEPGTFAALTQLADVHALTNRTGFGRLRASEIVDGKFTIEAEDASDDEVAWIVYAARADDFIQTAAPWVDNEGRLVPSQEKPSELLGLRRHGGHAEEEDD